MLLIDCPWCGPRPELEFTYAGEAHVARDPAATSEEAIADLLYLRSNPRGWHAERWRHAQGCGQFFNAQRHTLTDRFGATYRPGDPRPPLPDAEGGR